MHSTVSPARPIHTTKRNCCLSFRTGGRHSGKRRRRSPTTAHPGAGPSGNGRMRRGITAWPFEIPPIATIRPGAPAGPPNPWNGALLSRPADRARADRNVLRRRATRDAACRLRLPNPVRNCEKKGGRKQPPNRTATFPRPYNQPEKRDTEEESGKPAAHKTGPGETTRYAQIPPVEAW